MPVQLQRRVEGLRPTLVEGGGREADSRALVTSAHDPEATSTAAIQLRWVDALLPRLVKGLMCTFM